MVRTDACLVNLVRLIIAPDRSGAYLKERLFGKCEDSIQGKSGHFF